jgi:hypothetical protein
MGDLEEERHNVAKWLRKQNPRAWCRSLSNMIERGDHDPKISGGGE